MTQRDPLATATLAAIRALWDENIQLLATGEVYDYLAQQGQIAPPQSLTPTLEHLARAGNFRLSGGNLDAEAIALHGSKSIQDVAPRVLAGR